VHAGRQSRVHQKSFFETRHHQDGPSRRVGCGRFSLRANVGRVTVSGDERRRHTAALMELRLADILAMEETSEDEPLQELVPYQLRHSGASVDRSRMWRAALDVRRRGGWKQGHSMMRYEESAQKDETYLPAFQASLPEAELQVWAAFRGDVRNYPHCFAGV